MWMNIIQALGSSSPVERVANFVKSMIQKQILKQHCLDREDILILYWIMISKQTDNNWISLGDQFNTEERAHGTIHMIFAQTPHEYLLHMYMFHHLLIAIQRFHTGAWAKQLNLRYSISLQGPIHPRRPRGSQCAYWLPLNVVQRGRDLWAPLGTRDDFPWVSEGGANIIKTAHGINFKILIKLGTISRWKMKHILYLIPPFILNLV